jgi:nitroreductase
LLLSQRSSFFQEISMAQLLEQLQWRYATKKMDASKTVPQDKVDRIVEAARLAPSSSGLHPYEIIVVSNPEVRARIRAAANDQAQITEGSHLLVFAAWDTYTADRINHMFDLHVNARGGTNEGWENYRNMLLKNYPAREAQVNFEHAARQAYIGLGASLIAAALEQVDSTPMEGFQPAAVDEILHLSARGLRSVALMPLGYRLSGQDWLEPLVKVRRPRSEFVTEVK